MGNQASVKKFQQFVFKSFLVIWIIIHFILPCNLLENLFTPHFRHQNLECLSSLFEIFLSLDSVFVCFILRPIFGFIWTWAWCIRIIQFVQNFISLDFFKFLLFFGDSSEIFNFYLFENVTYGHPNSFINKWVVISIKEFPLFFSQINWFKFLSFFLFLGFLFFVWILK